MNRGDNTVWNELYLSGELRASASGTRRFGAVVDRNTILDQLKELDLPQPIELDVSGEPK